MRYLPSLKKHLPVLLPSKRSTGGVYRPAQAQRLIQCLPPDLEWREPFLGMGSVFSCVPRDRPRFGSDLDPNPVNTLIGFRDRPGQVIRDIEAGWRTLPTLLSLSAWIQWRDRWLSELESLDPAASYWLRWRAAAGGRTVRQAVIRDHFNNCELVRPELISRLWHLSRQLQGAVLEPGVDWEAVFDRPGDAVFFLDPPGPMEFARHRPNTKPLTIDSCLTIDWQRLSDRLREESRPWFLTFLDDKTHKRRDLFIFARCIQSMSPDGKKVRFALSNFQFNLKRKRRG